MNSDDSNSGEIETYVRKGDDGQQHTLNLRQWPGSPVSADGPPHIQVMMVALGGGDGELRHLSYDDPPGLHPEAGEWRDLLMRAAAQADDEHEFCQMLVMVLGKDLVLSHGCDPHVAIPAIVEFARKVYADYLGTI